MDESARLQEKIKQAAMERESSWAESSQYYIAAAIVLLAEQVHQAVDAIKESKK